MCGVLGTVNIPFNESVLNLIQHRGPDSSGITHLQSGKNLITFGHRRLSILELSKHGHQPMESHNKQFVLSYNGEIYNHLELRKKIPALYNGTSDTETLVNYIAKNGIDSASHLNGIFAFGIYDKQKELIHLVRDPFGVKPIYYYSKNNQFVFSSEIRAIKQLIPLTTINEKALFSTLHLRFCPSPLTLHKEIKKVRPGEVVTYNLKTYEISTKQLFQCENKNNKISFRDALEQYEILIEKSVKRQLLSDVEVGILLSGGIDSAIIGQLAQKHNTSQLKAFTIGFQGKNHANEINEAAESARILGLEHHHTTIDFNNFISSFKLCSEIVEEPSATTSVLPMYYLTKLAAKNVKVVLTGQGADEPLGGYTRYQGEITRNILPSPLRKLVSLLLSKSKNETVTRGLKAINTSDSIDRMLSTYELFSPEEIQALTGITSHYTKTLINDNLERFNITGNNLGKMMKLDARMNLPDDLLLYTDKISMHFSLETRVPFLDIDLVNFLESIPDSYKVKFRNTKIIHKKYAEKSLPSHIVNRKKKGFLSPTREWFKKHHHIIRDILTEENTKFSTIVNTKEVSRLIDSHRENYNMEKQIQLLMNLKFWVEAN